MEGEIHIGRPVAGAFVPSAVFAAPCGIDAPVDAEDVLEPFMGFGHFVVQFNGGFAEKTDLAAKMRFIWIIVKRLLTQ